MMYARTEFIYAVFLVASFVIEGTQAMPQVRVTTSSGIPLASPSVSSAPMLSFHPLPQPTSCASTTFSWSYSGPDDPMELQVTNVGVSQDAPPTTSTSSIITIARSTPLDLTLTLVTNYDPLSTSYVWNPVNVSQGWYRLLATISTDQFVQDSSPFFVLTGTNTSCLSGIISTTSTDTPTITPSKSSSPSFNASLPNNTIPASELSSTSTSTSKMPIIVGLSVGMAALVLGAVIVCCILTRKGRSRTGDGNSRNNRWKGFSDLRGGFDANASNKRYQTSRSHLTSQPSSVATNIGPESEDSIIGAEKVSEEQEGVALSTLPVLHHQPPRTRPDHAYSASSSSLNVNEFGKPSVRYSTQHPIDTSAVYPPSLTFSSRESGHYMASPDVSRSHSLSTQYSLSNSIDQTSLSPLSSSFQSPLSSSFQPPPPFASRENKQTNRQSLSKKRKPVPVYDPAEEEPVSSTSALALPFPNTDPTFPELSHKSSFGPGGIEGKQLHYLIPDMPSSLIS